MQALDLLRSEAARPRFGARFAQSALIEALAWEGDLPAADAAAAEIGACVLQVDGAAWRWQPNLPRKH